jgi:hypothetical protein
MISVRRDGRASHRLATLGLVLVTVIGTGAVSVLGASGPPFIARRQLDAAVSQVDRDAGVLLLKTSAGRLTLAVPADALRLVRKGDWVVLDIALLRHPDAARLPRDQEAKQPLLVQRLSAEVMSVQRSLGVVALKTSAGRLDVDLPEAATAGLHTGDRFPLELSVLLESEASALPRPETQTQRDRLGALLLSIFGARKK